MKIFNKTLVRLSWRPWWPLQSHPIFLLLPRKPSLSSPLFLSQPESAPVREPTESRSSPGAHRVPLQSGSPQSLAHRPYPCSASSSPPSWALVLGPGLWSFWNPLLRGGGIVTVTGWWALDGHQGSLCLCWAHGLLFVVGAMCSTVYCLSPPILLPHHCFSSSTCVSLVPSSFDSLFILQVSVVLCWSIVLRRVCVMFACTAVRCLPACFSPLRVVFVHFIIKKTHSSCTLSPCLISPLAP